MSVSRSGPARGEPLEVEPPCQPADPRDPRRELGLRDLAWWKLIDRCRLALTLAGAFLVLGCAAPKPAVTRWTLWRGPLTDERPTAKPRVGVRLGGCGCPRALMPGVA